MLGFEDYRLDLRYWEIEVVKDYLTESPKTYTEYPGHNKQVLVFTRKAS